MNDWGQLLAGICIGLFVNVITEPVRRFAARLFGSTRKGMMRMVEKERAEIETEANPIRGDVVSASLRMIRSLHFRIASVFWLVAAVALLAYAKATSLEGFFVYVPFVLGMVCLGTASSCRTAANRIQRVAEHAIYERPKNEAKDE